MSRTIRFHLDESRSSRALARALRQYGVDVSTTPEAELSGRSDLEQLQAATSEARVLFTQDEDFLVLHAQGNPHAGIIYCHQQKYSLGDLIRLLILVWEMYEPEELRNKLEYL
jgi:predicted nuclease of predicted toxin-antitoxin system